jgi:alpha-ketoglutarate-dependent taurine dioxygenase
VISSSKQKQGGGLTHQLSDTSRLASVGWHADITFEPVPSDYAMLKIHTLPETGGDTLWASGYEVYDRLSAPMAQFLEGLTATHDATFFHEEARRLGNALREDIRGSPLNLGPALKAVHPVIRTNRKFTSRSYLDSYRGVLIRRSRHRLEIGLREQGLYQEDKRHYQGRVRHTPGLSF